MGIINDQEIDLLLSDPKELPTGWLTRLQPRPKSGYQYDQRELSVQSAAGHDFRIVLRRNRINILDFSIILIFEEIDTDYRLIRCNGTHPSVHTNRWEKERELENSSFGPAFHIHRATERYQVAGLKIDSYAEQTEAYNDFNSALTFFFSEFRFQHPIDDQPPLF
jgi:hypothetical protein